MQVTHAFPVYPRKPQGARKPPPPLLNPTPAPRTATSKAQWGMAQVARAERPKRFRDDMWGRNLDNSKVSVKKMISPVNQAWRTFFDRF